MCKKKSKLGNFNDSVSVRKSVNLRNVFDVPSSVLGTLRATKKKKKCNAGLLLVCLLI